MVAKNVDRGFTGSTATPGVVVWQEVLAAIVVSPSEPVAVTESAVASSCTPPNTASAGDAGTACRAASITSFRDLAEQRKSTYAVSALLGRKSNPRWVLDNYKTDRRSCSCSSLGELLTGSWDAGQITGLEPS
jgi:hypothetical protein